MKANISTVAEFPQSKPKRKPRPVLTTQHKRSVQAVMAGIAAGFLPVASYVIAHIEAQSNPMLYALVAAALIYSAPTLATWAMRWTGGKGGWNIAKACGFTVLLEGVMVLSHIIWLSLTGLAILVSINAVTAYSKAIK